MNIMFLGRDLRIGGGTTFRLNVSRGLIARGHRVWVAGQPGEMASRLRQAGVQPLRVLPSPFNRLQLRYLTRRHGIDIVHASNVGRGEDAVYLRERSGMPFVLSIHGMLVPREMRYRCLPLAPRLIAFDESVLECLRGLPAVDARRVELVRRPIALRPDALAAAEGEFPAVVIGRLSRRKSQIARNVIAAFEQLAAEVPGARLTIVGGGSRLQAVRLAARDANRRVGRELIRVAGPLTDPWPVVKDAALVIGGGYAALEALIHGKAIVGAGFRGFGVVTADNVSRAVAVNFGDSGGDWEPTPTALLSAFREISAGCADPSRRDCYRNLDRIVGAEHTVERVSEHLERIYRDVLATEDRPDGRRPRRVAAD